MSNATLPELAHATRTDDQGHDHIETRHTGSIVVRSGDGQLVACTGEPELTTPLRSTAKPFQLLPFVMDGLHTQLPDWGGSEALADLAVMMSSHNGELMHTTRIARILERNGLEPASLKCGTHVPMHSGTRDEYISAGQPFNALHCNCSGKHTNMLLVCKAQKWSLDDYLTANHPLQRRIKAVLAELSGENADQLPVTVDGCSLPTCVFTLNALATLFSRLAFPDDAPRVEGQDIGTHLNLLFEAATKHPALIAGTGRLDTELMELTGGSVLAKTGAAGVYAMAVRPDAHHPKGLGITIKIADGDDDSRIRRVVAVETLKQLKLAVLDRVDPRKLTAVQRLELKNFEQVTVGRLESTFELFS